MIGIGIIGIGFGARVHLPAFEALKKQVRVVALAGTDASETKRIADEHRIQFATTSWRALIKHPLVEAVSVATPPNTHAEIVLLALKSGKHVLCKKPLSPSVIETDLMTQTAQKSRLVHGIDFEFRMTPEWAQAKKLVARGRIGQLQYIHISWLTGGRARKDLPITWRQRQDGGGVLSEFGSHLVDFIEWLAGPIVAVSTDLETIKYYPKRERRFLADDMCNMLLRLKNGAFANVVISNVVHGGNGFSIELYGTQGTLKLVNNNLGDSVYGFELFEGIPGRDGVRRLLTPRSFSRENTLPSDGRILAFREMAKQFIAAIQKKPTDLPDFTVGRRVQRVIEAARRSAQRDTWVKV